MEKIKRQDGNIASWIFFILTIFYNVFFTIVFYHEGVKIPDLLVFVSFEILLGAFTLLTFKGQEHIKIVSVQMYEFMIWDADKAKYVKRYGFTNNVLRANFILTFRIADSITSSTKKDIKKGIESELNWSKYAGYETKEQCMEDILKMVKDILASRKIDKDIKITDIEFIDTLDVEELINNILKENAN